MASIVVSGDTSGAVTITAPAIAGTTTLTLPTTSGTLVVTGGAQTIEFADGTVSAPSITNSGDTNTGIYFPAADTIAFTEGGTEAMRIDSSGNVLVGVTALTTGFSGFAQLVASGSSGGIVINSTAGNICRLVFTKGNSNGNEGLIRYDTGNYSMQFFTDEAERMRIDSSGNLLVGASSQPSFFSAAAKMYVETSGADYITAFRSTNASPSGVAVSYSTTPNGASNYFIDARDNTAQRFAVKSNGGIDNYSGNNTNLSDEREKTNIQLAGSYLDKICTIPVKTFNYIDQNIQEDDGLTLGVIAQDVQKVAPELVMESNWAGKDQPEKMRLSIYQTDLQYALMKSIQELNAKVEAQAAEIQALKGAK